MYGRYTRKKEIIRLSELGIKKLSLLFDNGDNVTLYGGEILELELGITSGTPREVNGGRIRFALSRGDAKLHAKDRVFFYTREATPENIEKRIVGEGKNDVDICEIEIIYSESSVSHGDPLRERFDVPDMDEPPYVIRDNITGEAHEYFGNLYVSGYAKRENDGTILIVFGRSVEEA
jgi:hypothetical protein